jgi:glycosyltransferase involved in cell wall biosynthesis
LDITFLVADQQKPHEGVVRPFVNFTKALGSKYHVSFLLLNCSDELLHYLEINSFEVASSHSKMEMVNQIKRIRPSLVFTDDDLTRLNLAQELKKKTNVKTASYVQILYGSHAIADCFDSTSLTLKEKLRFVPIKYVPFSFFSNRYAKLLKTFDLVIANSKVTASFLHSLYNVEVSGIVYPPIDTEVFQPSAQKNPNELTLYLGSHLGDSNKDFVQKIIGKATKHGYFVNLFGNAKMAAEITRKGNKSILYHSNLTDSELAQMYSRSKLTVCPQKWEQFGMVPVESLSCGTPVLAFNCMGFQETIDHTNGWLANNEADFLEILSNSKTKEQFSHLDIRKTAIKNFSIHASATALDGLLEKYFSQKT